MLKGALTPTLLQSVMTSRGAFQLIALIFGTWYVIVMYTLVRNVKERPASLVTQETPQPFVASIFRSLRNMAFRPLIFAWILDYAALSLIATMLPFYIKFWVEVDGENIYIGGMFFFFFCFCFL